MVYLGIQVLFFRHAFGTISAIVKQKALADDLKYMAKLKDLKNINLLDLGVRSKFWLNDQSLEDEKKKELLSKPLRRSEAVSTEQIETAAWPKTPPNSLPDAAGDRSSLFSPSLPAIPPAFTPFADAQLFTLPNKPDSISPDEDFSSVKGVSVTLAQDPDCS